MLLGEFSPAEMIAACSRRGINSYGAWNQYLGIKKLAVGNMLPAYCW